MTAAPAAPDPPAPPALMAEHLSRRFRGVIAVRRWRVVQRI